MTMNYPILLARLLLVAYCAFLLLFAVGEGIAEEGFGHLIIPAAIVLVLTVFVNKPLMSALSLLALFALSAWLMETYRSMVPFLIVSVPLAVASFLFFLGLKSREE